jgi:hypothetical protein
MLFAVAAQRPEGAWLRSGGPARMPVHDGGSLAGKLSADASETSSDGTSWDGGTWRCLRSSPAVLSLSFLSAIISSTRMETKRIHVGRQ